MMFTAIPGERNDRGHVDTPNGIVSVTVGIGVAETEDPKTDPADVIEGADDTLYRAKDRGLNQVSDWAARLLRRQLRSTT